MRFPGQARECVRTWAGAASMPAAAPVALAVEQQGERSDPRLTREQAAAALRKAVTFFRERVSAEGGYLWRYSSDLTRREGEGKADEKTAWVQPPGTPSVGEALLDVYLLTSDPFYLEAARETAEALIRGQLESGGWDYRIYFDPNQRRRYAYRVDSPTQANEPRPSVRGKRNGGAGTEKRPKIRQRR